MKKNFALLLFCALAITLKAQTPLATQPFGKIDKADLEMKACDFEKDANAMILFDKGDVYFQPVDGRLHLVTHRHKRIKIFNANGKNEGDIRLEYFSGGHLETISDLQAQTINITNGVVEHIKVDKKQIFNESVDNDHVAIVFSFANVQPGSVLEYQYDLISNSPGDFPNWYFQSHLPTRYSELTTKIPDEISYKNLERKFQPYAVDVKSNDNTWVRAIANVPSLTTEPYMTSVEDNCERLLFQLSNITPGAGYYSTDFSISWQKVGQNLIDNAYFGGWMDKKILGEEEILAQAKTLVSPDDKIAFIFNKVKNAMKWNKVYFKYSLDGPSKAWQIKSGTSGEINLIVYHLIKKAGIQGYTMVVSTRDNGKINPAYPNDYLFNSIVVYVPIDSVTHYVLDATNKYNVYNQIPQNLLNNFGLILNKDAKSYNMVFIDENQPGRQTIFIDGEIKADSKIAGTANIESYTYNRTAALEKYSVEGEKKYVDYLKNNDNNLQVSAIKFENFDVDTLPLKQALTFNLDLTGSDDNYIYFNPNMFGYPKINPFSSPNRFTDIDFGYPSKFALVGSYKMPAGYKIESLPKSSGLIMPDGSISFKRVTAEQGGVIIVRYVIDQKKSMFFKEDYPDIHEFFKKMYEMLNEQIVLKKS